MAKMPEMACINNLKKADKYISYLTKPNSEMLPY